MAVSEDQQLHQVGVGVGEAEREVLRMAFEVGEKMEASLLLDILSE